MSLNITEGATLTGGSAVVLASAGVSPGKSTFVGPAHSRAQPDLVELGVSGTTTGSNPVGRSSVKLTIIDRSVEEGCCTAADGSGIIDLGVRIGLNQPESVSDRLIARIRALVYTTAFENMVKKGILPS